jgi:hypothetical protein
MFDYKMFYFDNIPDEIVLYISTFLPHDDIVHFANTCWRLRMMFVRLCLEEHSQLLHVADINVRVCDGHGCSWQPSVYFETPPFTSFIYSAKISCTWRDQGDVYLHQKSHIYLHLIRPILKVTETLSINLEQKSQVKNEDIEWNTEMLVTDYTDLFGSAPHVLESACATLNTEDPIIRLALPGDYFRLIFQCHSNVGGGGEHKLIVNNFKLEISRIVKRIETSNIDQMSVHLVKTRTIFEEFRRYRTHLRRFRDFAEIRRYTRMDTRRVIPRSGLKKWRKYLKSPNLQITNVMAK